MEDNINDKQNKLIESFQSFMKIDKLFSNVIKFLPYPVEVYAPDGTSVFVNKAMLSEYHIMDSDMIVGKYNIFNDPYIIALGGLEKLKRAFQGETVFIRDIKVPLEEIRKSYEVQDIDVEAIYQDITIYPIMNDEKQVIYVVAFLINNRIYYGRNEIEKAKEYIESGWLNGFDLNEIARTVGFSKAHFIKLFKKNTGFTPHEYYINYKISRLREKLLDLNLSITQAFAACNMDYNGYSAGLFKKKTGLSPSAYRRMSEKHNISYKE